MRRMAAESAAIRSRSASTSRPGSLLLLNGSSSRIRYGILTGSVGRSPPWPAQACRTTGYQKDAMAGVAATQM